MKCLTIRQPWAHLIIHGVVGLDGSRVYKPVENRAWRTNFRGRFGVHAAKTFDPSELRYALEFLQMHCIANRLPDLMEYGCVIGTADLFACMGPTSMSAGGYTSPFYVGKWGFMLRNPRPITPSLPAWGALGFWEWTDCPEDLK